MLAGDSSATDVCRLMRLPGTVNSKHGDQRKVAVEKLDAAFRLDFDELEEVVADWRPLLTAKEEAKPVKGLLSSQRCQAINGKIGTTQKAKSRNLPFRQ